MNYSLLHSGQTKIPGLNFRSARQGPELDLVHAFLDSLDVKVARNCNVTLFQEPSLDSGFPDLVVVVWNKNTAEKWNPLRRNIRQFDIRVLHYLTIAGATKSKNLTELFGVNINGSLARLEAAELIEQHKMKYRSLPMKRIYATHSIIAIEAKISEWRRALDQASLNRWFASESFVLLPKIPRDALFLSQAKSLGVGVYVTNDKFCLDTREKKSLPISYASWMFNEWVWRAAINSYF